MVSDAPREGNRGGAGLFKWSDVAADKDRENYLGHSINAPVGRWQKNKDINWYNRDVRNEEEERLEEIRKLKAQEEEALSLALGFKPTDKSQPPPSTKTQEELDAELEAKIQAKAEKKALKRIEKEEKKARKEERRAAKAARREGDSRRPRSRSRSVSRSRSPPPRRRERSRSRSPRRTEDDRDRRRRYSDEDRRRDRSRDRY